MPVQTRHMCPGKRVGPVQGHGGDLNHQSTYPKPPTIPLKFPIRSTVLILSKLILKKFLPWGIRIILRVMIPVLGLIIFFTLPLIVLTCTFIKYYIKIKSVPGIWTLNCPIPQDYSKLMGGFQCTRGVDVSQWPKSFPGKHFVLTHYMLSLWWMNFMKVWVHYLIQPGSVDQVMVTTTSIADLRYTYSIYRLKKTPDIIVLTINLVWLSTWTTSIISCTLSH